MTMKGPYIPFTETGLLAAGLNPSPSWPQVLPPNMSSLPFSAESFQRGKFDWATVNYISLISHHRKYWLLKYAQSQCFHLWWLQCALHHRIYELDGHSSTRIYWAHYQQNCSFQMWRWLLFLMTNVLYFYKQSWGKITLYAGLNSNSQFSELTPAKSQPNLLSVLKRFK